MRIEPKSHGTLTANVKSNNGAAITDAVVTAHVFLPNGKRVASDITVPYSGSGAAYHLTILPTWSTAADGSAIEGKFIAEFTILRGAIQRTMRVPYAVTFNIQ